MRPSVAGTTQCAIKAGSSTAEDASCDAFGNFPPGLTGRTLVLTGKLPPTMFGLFMQQMRLRPLRRLPLDQPGRLAQVIRGELTTSRHVDCGARREARWA
jgi:hypothetical protein